MLKCKSRIFFLILIYPLVLNGQISNQTVGGWKVIGTTGTVTKACSRIVLDTAYNGIHSQSFSGELSNLSSIIFEKKYSQSFQKLSRISGEIFVYTKRMREAGYVYAFISFGNEFGYLDPTTALIIPGSGKGFFYQFFFSLEKVPPQFDRIKIKFLSVETDNFEIFIDYMFISDGSTRSQLIIDDFEDTTVPVRGEKSEIPDSFKLFQNYPNPFNPNTVIRFHVSNQMEVKLKVYDLLGEEVETLVNEVKYPGEYSIQFNCSNLSSGIYFYQLLAGDYISTKKMQLIK